MTTAAELKEPGAGPLGSLDTTRRNIVLGIGFAVLYFGLAAVLEFLADGREFSPLFAPAGVMFSLFVIGGARWIPVALVVRVVTARVLFPGDDSFADTVVIALLIIVPSAVFAEILRTRPLRRAHPRQFAWFGLLGIACTPTGAMLLLAARETLTNDDVDLREAIRGLRVFWVGDALAIATITPLVLITAMTLRRGFRPRNTIQLTAARRTEYALMVLAVAGAPVLSSAFVTRGGPPALVILATLPLLWVALRQDLLQAAIGMVVAVVIVSVSLRRTLDFDDQVEVQYLLLCGVIAALFAASVRRLHEDVATQLLVEQNRYRQVDELTPIHFTELNPDGTLRPLHDTDNASALDAHIDAGIEGRWKQFGPTVIERADPMTIEWTLGDGDGERSLESMAIPVEVPVGGIDHVLVVTSDRTALRQATEAAKRAQTHDPDTGLPNRRQFLRTLAGDVLKRQQTPGVMVVSFSDVLDVADGESAVGLVPEIARIVRDVVDADGRTARLGDSAIGVTSFDGDAAGGDLAALRRLADQVMAELGATAGPIGRLPVSIGIAEGRGDAGDAVMRAERAARAAAELGGDRVLVYHPALHQSQQRELVSVEELRRACEGREFEVYYQPIVRLDGCRSVGAEALVRWNHPTRGLVAPNDFIPDAERSGLIVRIDDLVCDIVGDDLAAWSDAGLLTSGFSVSINISPVHLVDPELANRLRLLAERVDARRIRIEITESAAMRDPEYTVELLHTIRELGYTVILDDFGTGYSSMAWLHRLPAQVLKIDRSFVADVTTDVDALRIIELMVSLAEDLGIAITAEGIETQQQADILTEIGCTYGQGFLFGRPVASAEAAAMFGADLGPRT
ncbi:MAG: EAL domain-containing protein [Ilumatobacter sp.]